MSRVVIEFTFYWWWLAAYLAVGVVLFLPLNWLAMRKVHNPDPFWVEMRRASWKAVVLQVVLWPLAIRELVR